MPLLLEGGFPRGDFLLEAEEVLAEEEEEEEVAFSRVCFRRIRRMRAAGGLMLKWADMAW